MKKVFFMHGLKCGTIVSCFFSLFWGCSTPKRNPPNPIPRFVTGYVWRVDKNLDEIEQDKLAYIHRKFKRLPVRPVFYNCRDKCIMSNHSTFSDAISVDTSLEAITFGSIVKQEISKLVTQNFEMAGDEMTGNKKARLILSVEPTARLSRDNSGEITCFAKFIVKLEDPEIKDKIYFWDEYTETVKYHDIEGFIPCSLYAAVQKVVKRLIDDMSRNPEQLLLQLGKLVPPLQQEFDYIYEQPVKEGVHYRGSAKVRFADTDDPDEVKKQAVNIIKNRGKRYFLGTPYCVFFSEAICYKESMQWGFAYDIIAREDIMVIENNSSGRCFIDCEKRKIYDNEKAAAQMKEKLMRKHPHVNGVEVFNVHLDEENPEFRVADYKYQ